LKAAFGRLFLFNRVAAATAPELPSGTKVTLRYAR
jgi:hypothetical protein